MSDNGKGDVQPTSTSDPKTDTKAACDCPFAPSAWFNPSKIQPQVGELIYWRDVKKSGIVFSLGLLLLLSFACCSIISVVAYTSLLTLLAAFSYRIYKDVMQAVQKTNDKHAFSEYLDKDITPSKERVHQIVDIALDHLNCVVLKLRNYFLIANIIDSLKFGLILWCLTYVGAWFNGITLIIMAYVSIFSIPRLYEMNKAQIDQYLAIACTQTREAMNMIKSKLPFLNSGAGGGDAKKAKSQ